MTRSGRARTISSLCAVQESAMIARPLCTTSGQTSAQYFVQATMRSSLPIAARITVALGCRETIRRGVWSVGITSYGTREVTILLAMYSPELLDHFQNPRNAGDVLNPDASVQIENPACGDILKLSVRMSDDRIAEIRFRAKGCVPAMACASLLTELLLGRTIEDARNLRRGELVLRIGGLPEASVHASHLALDAWTALLKQLKTSLR